MLYLHCGWPKTGTTSLQAALAARRGDLAEAGTIFPSEWKSGKSFTHHGISMLPRKMGRSESAIEEFLRFLDVNSENDVLFSAEGITTWLFAYAQRDDLLRFFATAQETTSMRCVWTIRRFDELFCSQYLHWARWVERLPLPTEVPRRHLNPSSMFAGLRRVENVVEDNVYVKYRRDSTHNAELLRAFGLLAPQRDAVLETISAGPRLNLSFSQKQAAAVIFHETLSARAGVDLDLGKMRRAFIQGEINFDDDQPCTLVDISVKRDWHERALAAARLHGFSSYTDFFADAEVFDDGAEVVNPDAITVADLARLVEHLSED